MWIKHLWNISHIPYSPHDESVARTFENKNHIKTKRTCIDLWKMDVFEKEYHSWMLDESVIYQVLNEVQLWHI